MLIGRLGKNPEIRYSRQGLPVANFPIATNEKWTDKNTGDRQEKTEWHRIVVFGKQAEVCEKYLSKGSQIYIEGRLQTRNYEKDGQTHYIPEIVAANFQSFGGKQDNQGDGDFQQADSGSNNHSHGATNPSMTGGQKPIPDDEIPF